MYLASFLSPDEVITQGMVWMPGLPLVPESIRVQWWKNYTELVHGIPAVGGAGASLRVTVDPGVSLHRVLFASTAQTRSTELRRFLAPFTRLEALVTGSATLPLSREDYDVVSDNIPHMRCRIATAGFQAGGARLACDFRINPFLESLLAQAEAYGYRLSYQVNVRPVEIDREQIRAARKNVLVIRDLPGIPSSLVALEQRLVEQLLHATAVCEEYLAVDAGPAVWWLQETLGHNFKQQFSALRFEAESWEFIEGGYEEEFACAASTTADDISIDELCAGAIEGSQVTELLGWRPSDDFADRFAHPPVVDVHETPETSAFPASVPPPYTGPEPYIFVSYKRADVERVFPAMFYLQGLGYKLWYDRGIRGGDDWTAILEEKLTSCSAVLLFLSQASIDSKHVRREVLFADSINKRIISIRLEATELKHGMGLLLPRYQIIDHRVGDFLQQLGRALNDVR